MSVVLYEKRGNVAYVTVNRPEAMNALSQEVKARLADAWDAIENDRDVWAAIVTGAGDKAFSAGADLKEMGKRLHGPDSWEVWRP
ncbi:MAG: enoyl-CoA hydratase/isomerase family protein [Chloroflexi bacterium]|nr:enoyl-CoA hydratase/isomerase family protein [Chloroflexota bacterium]